MTSPIRRSERSAPVDLPPLPALVRTRDGQIVDPSAARWTIRKRADGGGYVDLIWERLKGFSASAVHLAKVIVAARLADQAPMSARGDWATLARFSRWYVAHAPNTGAAPLFDWDLLDAKLGHAFVEHGLTTGNAGNDFSRLRDLYRYGTRALRHAHFQTSVLLQLEAIRAPCNAKGRAVRAGDPDEGELSPDEIEAIVDAIKRRAGTDHDRLLTWLCLELGRNSLQYSLLRNSDLRRVVDSTTRLELYQLAVRRIKKRTAKDEKRLWPISSELGDQLWALRKGGPEDSLLWWLDRTRPEWDLNARLKRFASKADLRSQRNGGKRLKLNPRRFRVTLLTNAADEGGTAEHLAALADHSDTQSVMVYIDNSPAYMLRVAEKVDRIYDPVVKRFKGKLAPRESADGAEIPGFAPQLPLLDLAGIGKCGSKEICRLAPPLTCYTCDRFVAYRDGPHEQVVEAMEASMEKMGPRVALQVAPALAAAREVVRQIKGDTATTKNAS